jgi:hypothetical protein
MGNIEIEVYCPKCSTKVQAQYAGTERELLRKILQRAGVQSGDILFNDCHEED